MRIILVGCGKVGYTIAKNLAAENDVDVTIIDNDQDALDKASEAIDAMLLKGNGLNADTLIEAGVRDADILISVTSTDETNILCCVIAKSLGISHTVARVRSPEYAENTNKFWMDLGLDMIINPEFETAREVSRLLRFPTVDDIDTFAGGRVELVSFKVSDAWDFFEGKSVTQIFNTKKMNILLAVVERDDTAIIPNGSFEFEQNDIIRILGRPSSIMDFITLMGKNTYRIKNIVIIGGSSIAHYLVELLHKHNNYSEIKVIEKDKERCEELSERFPRCLIINGDGTDEDIIKSEVLDKPGAVICLTSRDEENTIIALYSRQADAQKVILKINYINKNMMKDLGLGSIVSPQNITSDQIIRYVRGLSNASAGINTIYQIFSNDDEKVEVIEFNASDGFEWFDTPIKKMKFRSGVLIGCIVRNSNIIIPSGDTSIQNGDNVIIIAKNQNVRELNDILSN